MKWRDLSYQSLAKQAGLGISTVRRALRHDVSAGSMSALAAVLGGTAADYVIGGAGADALIARLKGGRSLGEVVEQLLAWEDVKQPLDELVVKNLAIDQADGWPILQAALNRTRSKRLAIDAVMLTPDPQEIGPPEDVPPEVRGWAAAGAANFDMIRGKLRDLPAGGKPFHLRIKFYARVPTLHGLLVRSPQEAAVAFSRCETRPGSPPAYSHGPNGYRVFGTAGVDVCAELVQYETLFDELWAARSEFALDFHYRRSAGG